MTDDRERPDRATNTAMLNQVGQAPPSSVLAAVLAATNGETPVHVAALPEWGDKESIWRVLGCTDSALFEVVAHKKVADWYASRGAKGEQETISMTLRPLSDVSCMTFELEEVYADQLGREAVLYGSWRVDFRDGGSVVVPHVVGRVNEALEGIVATVRRSL